VAGNCEYDKEGSAGSGMGVYGLVWVRIETGGGHLRVR
jgi:hypothetical protein